MCIISPDGKWIGTKDFPSNEPRMYPVDGGQSQPIPGLLPGENFSWTSDPNFIYVYQWKQPSMKIYRLSIETGQRQLFKEVIPVDTAGLCDLSNIMLSADGRAYVYGYTRLLSDLYLVKGLQ